MTSHLPLLLETFWRKDNYASQKLFLAYESAAALWTMPMFQSLDIAFCTALFHSQTSDFVYWTKRMFVRCETDDINREELQMSVHPRYRNARITIPISRCCLTSPYFRFQISCSGICYAVFCDAAQFYCTTWASSWARCWPYYFQVSNLFESNLSHESSLANNSVRIDQRFLGHRQGITLRTLDLSFEMGLVRLCVGCKLQVKRNSELGTRTRTSLLGASSSFY